MKLRKLIRRMTAALVAGAMALSLCAPALAEGPGETADTTGCDFIVGVGSDPDSATWVKVDEPTEDILGDDSGISYQNGVIFSDHTITQPLAIRVAPGKTVDVKVTVSDGPAVNADFAVIGAHDVELTSANSMAVTGSLNVYGARNVTLLGNSPDATLNASYIACSGSLLAKNTGSGSVNFNHLAYVNLSDAETVYRSDGNFWGVLDPNDSTQFGNAMACISAGAEQTFTLTVENGYASHEGDMERATAFYAGEEVDVYGIRPVNALGFDGWDMPETVQITDESSSEPYLSILMPDSDTTITAKWKKADNTEITVMYSYGGEPLTLTPTKLPADGTMTFENNVLTINLPDDETESTLTLMGLEDPNTGALPSVVLNGTVADNMRADGLQDLTIMAEEGYAIGGMAEFRCSGDVNIQNTDGGAVVRNLYVEDARNVTVKVDAEDMYALGHTVKIRCSGDVNIENSSGGGIYYDLWVYDANNVTVTVDDEARDAVDDDVNITCSGDVILTNRSGGLVNYPLTIENARNVTLEGSSDKLIGYDEDDEHTIHCSGTVTLRNNSSSGNLFLGQLTYRPDARVEAYTIQVDGQPKRADAVGDTVFTIGQPSITVYQVDDTGTDEAPADTWDNDLTGARELVITPTLRSVEPGTAGTGSGSAGSIGGAIAAAAIGGAAIWGGYEVATRVILHQLLPAGAAIPKTQAELAVLLWTTAGSPEPLNAPAFADVDETTAKAAQWCTEQGYLTDTFQPDKHVAKYNVIRAWNKAFPKAK